MEKTLLKATVFLLFRNNIIILAKKHTNPEKIGAGCRNGYGGGPEKNEAMLACGIRELEEESGIIAKPHNCEKVAIAKFHNTKTNGETFICEVHYYIVKDWVGKPKETKDGTMLNPLPYHKDFLPFEEMMPADKEYFPFILNGKKVLVEAKYGPYQKELLGPVKIIEVATLPEN